MALELDERIAPELKKLYNKVENEGKLLSKEQLDGYYRTFRDKFGPDKLANLDGEALLETMHSHGNKDSLVYWLEFKDDEEFPSPKFGSIAGGSAFKFGLFRKQENGKWISGSPKIQIELTVEQAIAKARDHRDQLIRGIELLERMPAIGRDEDYQHLQDEMNRVAPDVSDSVWGHKYFSLLYPEKLDDFHNPDYQRFHLIRLLQLPPQGAGRYIAAGRFVAIAHNLSIPLHSLTTLLNIKDGGDPYKYWRIGTTAGATDTSFWEKMRDNNYVSIGWSQVKDLSNITDAQAGKKLIQQDLLLDNPQAHHGALGRTVQQIANFRWAIAVGDLVLASQGATILGIGRVIGDYFYAASEDFPHCLPVEWLSLETWQQPDQDPGIEGKLTTVYQMKRNKNLLAAEKRIYGTPPPPPPPPPVPDDQDIIQVPHPPLIPPRLKGIPARIQSILERKGQVILYGPPGTGKTYWAELTAYELAARTSFGAALEQLTDEQKDALKKNGRVQMCCFHPAYGYEDFIEGFRPETVSGQMHFVSRKGIFKKLCEEALSHLDEKFYLIIDEINRGEIPRIFGELLTILEKDKRTKSILLPLSQERFQVPHNVYIIGTMNTADRSIALLDAALRRRFGFIELMPDYEPLKYAVAGGIPLGLWLESLNHRIRENVGQDARNLQIGHAYLLERGNPITDLTTFAHIVQDDILPLLEEYCYEDYAKLESILGTGLVDAKNQQINYDLFSSSQQANLITALLALDPNITTTAEAAAIEVQTSEAQEDADSDAPEDENANDYNRTEMSKSLS